VTARRVERIKRKRVTVRQHSRAHSAPSRLRSRYTWVSVVCLQRDRARKPAPRREKRRFRRFRLEIGSDNPRENVFRFLQALRREKRSAVSCLDEDRGSRAAYRRRAISSGARQDRQTRTCARYNARSTLRLSASTGHFRPDAIGICCTAVSQQLPCDSIFHDASHAARASASA